MTSTRSQLGSGGLVLALVAAMSFGTSGTFATSLTEAGWTTGAAVIARVTVAALVLTVPGLVQLRNHVAATGVPAWQVLRRGFGVVAGFGLVAIAACQLAYFNAVQRLNVGVALLLEYLGVVLVVLYVWLRHGQRPRRLTLLGSVGALAGLVLVLNLTGARGIDPVGVLWGLSAAVGLAVFYILSSQAEDPIPPITMAWASMTIGAVGLIGLAATGVLPVHAHMVDVHLAGRTVSWVVPVLGLSVVAAALSYIAGIGAARRLGARLASFVGLTEVLFAVLFAWLLLGQLPARVQLLGGALILAGVALVRIDESRQAVEPDARAVLAAVCPE
jgi:drug/metabolite transporter (DMT)-like permease